jgi:hypothetical protein
MTGQPGWGRWTFHADNVTLVHGDDDGHEYEVDIEECRTSAKALDLILQVSKKTWSTDADVANLLAALNDLIDPQATLCSFGEDKRIADVRALLAKRGRI